MLALGQALGGSVFGGLLNASLPAAFAGAGGDIDARVFDPSLRGNLPATDVAQLTGALAHGLHNVYLVSGLLVLFAAGMGLSLPAGLSPARPASDRVR